MRDVNKIKCEEVKTFLPLYLADELDELEKKEVEEHIHECEKCKKLFYSKEDEILMQDNKELTKDFKRMKTRFIRTVAYTVIGCLLIINLAMALLPIITKEAFKEQEAYAKKAHIYDIVLREPLVEYIRVDSNVGLLDTFIKCKYDISIQGNSSIHVEENIKIPNFSGYAKFERELEQYTTLAQFNSSNYLLSAIHRKADASVKDKLSAITHKSWSRLDDFPKGTLSQVAVYFKQPVSVEDIIDLLNGIGDIHLYKCWFCFDTGKIDRKSAPYLWGFSTMIFQVNGGEVDIGFNGEKTTLLTNNKNNYKVDDLRNVASAFQKEMKEYEKYVSGLRNFYSLNGYGVSKEDLLADIKAINNQIENEGVQIQSAILTAPTENLLKLKENSNIEYINIVGVGFDSFISE